MAERVQYFFVCGAPKSGTTWLQLLFDWHPEIVCSGEGHFIERLILPINRVKDEYNRHLGLVAERVYQGKPYYEPLTGREVAFVGRALIEQLMRKRNKPGAKAIGDKTPRYTEFLFELCGLFPDAKFIHIVRDPRDVTVSRLHHALRAGFKDSLTPGSVRYRELVQNSVLAWNTAQNMTGKFAQARPQQFLEIRYEDLARAPQQNVGRLFEFVGVAATPQQIEEANRATSFEKLSGRKPGVEDKMSFFRKGVSGDWGAVLDDPAEAKIRQECGRWMEAKGYSGAGERMNPVVETAAQNAPKA